MRKIQLQKQIQKVVEEEICMTENCLAMLQRFCVEKLSHINIKNSKTIQQNKTIKHL
jgi:hypothetical protein